MHTCEHGSLTRLCYHNSIYVCVAVVGLREMTLCSIFVVEDTVIFCLRTMLCQVPRQKVSKITHKCKNLHFSMHK